MALEGKILQILNESKGPLGASEIAEKIRTERDEESESKEENRTERSSVHYHLKKLTDRGILQSKNGKYFLSEISEIVDKIIALLSEKDCNFLDIQNLGNDKDHIRTVLNLLESKGWVYINHPNIVRSSEQCDRETIYALTPLAYTQKGLCPICKISMEPSETVIIATIRTIKKTAWTNVSIHAKCYVDSGDIYVPEKNSFCDFCGLPISPKPLLGQKIGYKDILNNFYKLEYNTISLLEDLYGLNHYRYNKPKNYQEIKDFIQRTYEFHMERCKISEFPDFILKVMEFDEKPKRDIISENDAIIKNFENSEVNMEYQSELKKADEIPIENRHSYYDLITEKRNISEVYKKFDSEQKRLLKISQEETQYINPIHLYILKDLNVLVHGDLSYLQEVEEFLNCIKKYNSNFPDDYDIKSRIKDIWLSALKLKQEREKNILRMYERLLQPSGFVYTHIQPLWAFDTQERKIVQDEESASSRFFEAFQFMAFKQVDKFYHPFCAEKLGLKDSGYCNNINIKGGESNE